MRDGSQLAGNSQAPRSREPERAWGKGQGESIPDNLQGLRELRGTTATLEAPEKAASERGQESP